MMQNDSDRLEEEKSNTIQPSSQKIIQATNDAIAMYDREHKLSTRAKPNRIKITEFLSSLDAILYRIDGKFAGRFNFENFGDE